MKKIILFLLVNISLINAQSEGENLFKQKCVACHSIGSGKLVGPDLANISKRRTEQWIIKFVQSSQALIKSGDSIAVAVFEENNKIVMPDHDLTPNQIKSIISYIGKNSPDTKTLLAKSTSQSFNASLVTQADITKGKELFEGTIKFANGGTSCITCHNVNIPGSFHGGRLARDLTNVFSRLGAAGIDGILRNPPFPAMIDGFGTKPLTDEEIRSILAYLYNADLQSVNQSSLQSQFDLLIGTIIILNIFLAIFFILWERVKKYSVNLK